MYCRRGGAGKSSRNIALAQHKETRVNALSGGATKAFWFVDERAHHPSASAPETGKLRWFVFFFVSTLALL